MMIKICKENSVRLDGWLNSINGASGAHTFSDWADLEDVARRAEAKLMQLVQLKKHAVGAVYTATSGERVPNAYKYSRRATNVTIVRRAAGWFLKEAHRVEIWSDGGYERISLTEFQNQMAIRMFKAQYYVLPTEAVEVAA